MSIEQRSKDMIGKSFNPFSINEGVNTKQYYPISQSTNMTNLNYILPWTSRASSQQSKASDLSQLFSQKLMVNSNSSNENS